MRSFLLQFNMQNGTYRSMKGRTYALAALVLAGSIGCAPSESGQGQVRLRLATTTSTENSGLLAVLHPPFEEANHCHVAVIPVGTGKALKLGENGDADVVLVHARAAEDSFVDAGFGVNRRDVMHNDFVVLGPKADPAGVRQVRTAVEAFRKLAAGKATFFSRGDNSGTHKKERALWRQAGIVPKGDWYAEVGRGMGAVLTMTDEKLSYTLCDRGTFLAYGGKIDLVVLFEGDPVLLNPYGVIAVNPKRHPKTNYKLAMKYIAYLTGPQGQEIIGRYRKNGRQLFYPDAIAASQAK
jgi:tungstate transport system substrate-binding protein